MDWSKAKTILIAALIVTNFVLGYFLYVNQNNKDTTISDNFVEEVVVQLESRNIKIDTKIPRESSELVSLTVEYEVVDAEDANQIFFDGRGRIAAKGEGLVEIHDEDGIISIISDKLIRYESNNTTDKYDIRSEEDAINIATEFLEDKNISLSDMKLSYIRKNDDSYDLEFTKLYGDYYLESTFTNMKVDNKGVVRFERNWLNSIEIGDRPIEITSAPKSLLAILGRGEVQRKTIVDISICYYFDPGKHGYDTNPGEVQQGTTIPAWRIQFDDGYKIFVDNY